MQTNDFDEIYIENEHEHIYGYKDGEAVEIVPPHSPEFEQMKENILYWDFVVCNNSEFEVILRRKKND